MGQEFVIKSTTLEDKINQLLPSQSGFQAGVDLSASTTSIPIVDLTESAEGSNLRQDLQTSLSLTTCTAFNVSNTTSTLINTTGYFRIFGTFDGFSSGAGARSGQFSLTDGTTTKILTKFNMPLNSLTNNGLIIPYDFTVFLRAGDSLQASTTATQAILTGVTRQIADINGNLINP